MVMGPIPGTLAARCKYTLDGMPVYRRAHSTGIFEKWEETGEDRENHNTESRPGSRLNQGPLICVVAMLHCADLARIFFF